MTEEDSRLPLNNPSLSGRVGRTADGRVIVVRDGSSSGFQKGTTGKGDITVEIKNPTTGKSDKIRY